MSQNYDFDQFENDAKDYAIKHYKDWDLKKDDLQVCDNGDVYPEGSSTQFKTPYNIKDYII